MDAATAVSLVVATLALGFTVASFWWLNAREGKLEATRPRAYAFTDKVRLRLPLAFFNTGAKALIVTDLRVVVDGDPSRAPLFWTTTRDRLRPEENDGFAFPTSFAVEGRNTKEVIVEFGDDLGWSPKSAKHELRVQALIHHEADWVDLVFFDWWPPPKDKRELYLTHPNEPAAP